MSKNLSYFETGKGKQWSVVIKGTDQVVAVIYRQQRNREYRFRLVNYPQRMSKVHKDIPACLKAIEQEVL